MKNRLRTYLPMLIEATILLLSAAKRKYMSNDSGKRDTE